MHFFRAIQLEELEERLTVSRKRG